VLSPLIKTEDREGLDVAFLAIKQKHPKASSKSSMSWNMSIYIPDLVIFGLQKKKALISSTDPSEICSIRTWKATAARNAATALV
jgi:hypothetical protein